MMGIPIYRRIILKLSGDILRGGESIGIDFDYLGKIADEIAIASRAGVQIGIVVGGGNLIRGSHAVKMGYSRIIADNMGMLSTVINAMALQDAFEQRDIPTRVMSAIQIMELVEPFIRRRAIRHLEKGRIVIFAAGTGNPFFTTDTAAALRASQIGAEAILKGTKVEGVYDRDPKLDDKAIMFDTVNYMEILQRELKVMDLTAITFSKDFNIPIHVFNILEPGYFWRIICGESLGTVVRENYND